MYGTNPLIWRKIQLYDKSIDNYIQLIHILAIFSIQVTFMKNQVITRNQMYDVQIEKKDKYLKYSGEIYSYQGQIQSHLVQVQ